MTSVDCLCYETGVQWFGAEFSLAKTLIALGLGVAGLGVFMLLLERVGISLGNLPGDIRVEGKRGGIYFPIVTCIVLSIVGSILLNLFGKK